MRYEDYSRTRQHSDLKPDGLNTFLDPRLEEQIGLLESFVQAISSNEFAIVALPLNLFYTGVATYIWLLSNRKAAHRCGKRAH